jgi:hypothetical protein
MEEKSQEGKTESNLDRKKKRFKKKKNRLSLPKKGQIHCPRVTNTLICLANALRDRAAHVMRSQGVRASDPIYSKRCSGGLKDRPYASIRSGM